MPPPISVKTEPGMEHTSLRVPLPIDQPSSQPLDIDAVSIKIGGGKERCSNGKFELVEGVSI